MLWCLILAYLAPTTTAAPSCITETTGKWRFTPESATNPLCACEFGGFQPVMGLGWESPLEQKNPEDAVDFTDIAVPSGSIASYYGCGQRITTQCVTGFTKSAKGHVWKEDDASTLTNAGTHLGMPTTRRRRHYAYAYKGPNRRRRRVSISPIPEFPAETPTALPPQYKVLDNYGLFDMDDLLDLDINDPDINYRLDFNEKTSLPRESQYARVMSIAEERVSTSTERRSALFKHKGEILQWLQEPDALYTWKECFNAALGQQNSDLPYELSKFCFQSELPDGSVMRYFRYGTGHSKCNCANNVAELKPATGTKKATSTCTSDPWNKLKDCDEIPIGSDDDPIPIVKAGNTGVKTFGDRGEIMFQREDVIVNIFGIDVTKGAYYERYFPTGFSSAGYMRYPRAVGAKQLGLPNCPKKIQMFRQRRFETGNIL